MIPRFSIDLVYRILYINTIQYFVSDGTAKPKLYSLINLPSYDIFVPLLYNQAVLLILTKV